jgi:predicted HAD superfamily hydrolase
VNADRLAIEGADVVSFDLFDTLLLRRVSRPVDIFRLTHEVFNASSQWYLTAEFAPVRVRCEAALRAEAVADDRSADSVTFEEIHRSVRRALELPEGMAADLARTELETERRMLRANPPAVALMDHAVSLGKEVVVTSDTYFPVPFIDEVLVELGMIGWKDLYLSCDRGQAKSDGSLFAGLAASYPNARIVHFGDNAESDVAQAEAFGIRARWLPKPADVHQFGAGPTNVLNGRMVFQHLDVDGYRLANVQRSMVNALIGQRCGGFAEAAPAPSEEFAIGYGALGPLLVGVVQWLHASAVAAGCRRLLFFARDGAIMQRAYRCAYGNAALPSTYVLASRRLLNLPAMDGRLTTGDVDFLTQSSVPIPVAEYFDRLGIDGLDIERALQRTELGPDDVGRDDFDRLRAAMWLLEDQLLAAARAERRQLARYIEQEELAFEAKTGIVDIGWHGSVQWAWERVLSLSHLPCDIEGFYFGLHPARPARFDHQIMHAYVDGRADDDVKLHGDLIGPSVSLLEFFFTSEEGTVVGLDQTGDGRVVGRFAEDGLRGHDRAVLRNVQAGALAFVEDFRMATDGLPSTVGVLNRHVATETMVMLANFPSRRAARILGELPHADGFGERVSWTKIGAPRYPLSQYRHGSRRLRGELEASNWKQGFAANSRVDPASARGGQRLNSLAKAIGLG